MSYHLHNHCRACGFAVSAPGTKCTPNDRLVPVLDLGIQPLANDFHKEDESMSGYYPLKVLLCPRCSLAQLSVVVAPQTLYSHYSYVTSRSKTMQQHFEAIRGDILKEAHCANSVLEIGSNDGTLLAYLKNNPFEVVLGCDPAENLAAIANHSGIPTFCGLFSYENCDCQLPKDVVIARHVMCHIDDWRDFVRGLERVTHKESLVCIEVPYYRDMIKNNSWDQIYAEHLSYMSVRALDALVRDSMFHIHKVIKYPIHGGSIMVYLRRNESAATADPGVQAWLEEEAGFVEEWDGLAKAMESMAGALRSLVVGLVREGKRVVGYGASAKSTVWLNACGFTKKHLAYICDNTSQKQYTLSPGSDIQVVPDGMLTADLPDVAILFSWNYQGEIVEKEKYFQEHGGRWLIPVPTPTLL